MLNKSELNEFIDSFEYVERKANTLLEELSSFKDTDIQIKEELKQLRALLSKFSNIEQKLKDDVNLIIRSDFEDLLENHKKQFNKNLESINYLTKKIEKLDSRRPNCLVYLVAGIAIGLIPLLFI